MRKRKEKETHVKKTKEQRKEVMQYIMIDLGYQLISIDATFFPSDCRMYTYCE